MTGWSAFPGSLVFIAFLLWGQAVMAQRAEPERRFFLRLSLGPTYLVENWTPANRAASARLGGWGTALDASIGWTIQPRLIVGGRWEVAAFVEPNESYEGTTYVLDGSALLLNTLAAFVDWTPTPRRGLHVGGSLGLITRSNLDNDQHSSTTGWGLSAAGQAGYDRQLSTRWSIGVAATLAVYRCWTTEAGVASVSDGLLPSLSVAFTLR